jgi:hypothetical protein
MITPITPIVNPIMPPIVIVSCEDGVKMIHAKNMNAVMPIMIT